MELSPKQQTVEMLRGAQRVLLLSHENPDGDALGSLLALALVLSKLKKEVTAAVADTVPQVFNFLPQLSLVRDNVQSGKEFTITLDTSELEIDKLGYKTDNENKRLNIVITTKTGTLEPRHVSVGTSTLPYDLIVILDTPDLDRLGEIYNNDPELFYNVPVVNIDHHSSNEYYGKTNWVDVTATSTAEILVSLIEALSTPQRGIETVSLMDADVATLLLTGLTTDTGSFQNANTTPKSLTVAAQLVASGARQQEIIRNIFKTKPMSTLKLWGRALMNLKEVPEASFIYSTLSKADFVTSGADDKESSGVIDEFIKTATGVDFVLLLVERNGGVHGSLRSVEKGIDVSNIARIFGGGGHDMASAFHLANTTLEREIGRIIGKISDFQSKQLQMKSQSGTLPLSQTMPEKVSDAMEERARALDSNEGLMSKEKTNGSAKW